MIGYFQLIPIALGLGLTALAAFMWSLKSGQYDDLDGAAERVLHEETDAPIPTTPTGAVTHTANYPVFAKIGEAGLESQNDPSDHSTDFHRMIPPTLMAGDIAGSESGLVECLE
jgi:cbb3-type cytochrome oxidase maturation protein